MRALFDPLRASLKSVRLMAEAIRWQTAAALPCWLVLHAIVFAGNAMGMELRIYHQPEINFRMIIAEGRIETGDAERLRALARITDRDDEGLVMLVLNSPGGNVEAAFRFVDAMDEIRVYTAVPDNARCASACASILFASGERRSVLGSGMLGFHSCYRRNGKTYIEDSLCNEIVAANAMQRGISHAAINRFVATYGARDMAWVSRNTICKSLQGLCKAGRLENRPVSKAALARSLDCSKLASIQAQLICGDTELARVDKELADAYWRALKTGKKASVRNDQRVWIQEHRNKCSDKACLLQTYRMRMNELRR